MQVFREYMHILTSSQGSAVSLMFDRVQPNQNIGGQKATLS